jgi:hypothetical protein
LSLIITYESGTLLSRICSSVSLVATPRPPQGADRFMLTTILAYVIAAVGLATILAGGWSFVMLAIQDERDRPFRHYDSRNCNVRIRNDLGASHFSHFEAQEIG